LRDRRKDSGGGENQRRVDVSELARYLEGPADRKELALLKRGGEKYQPRAFFYGIHLVLSVVSSVHVVPGLSGEVDGWKNKRTWRRVNKPGAGGNIADRHACGEKANNMSLVTCVLLSRRKRWTQGVLLPVSEKRLYNWRRFYFRPMQYGVGTRSAVPAPVTGSHYSRRRTDF